LGDECVALEEYGIYKGKGLSNRMCYDGSISGMKVDEGDYDTCAETFRPNWETPNRRYP